MNIVQRVSILKWNHCYRFDEAMFLDITPKGILYSMRQTKDLAMYILLFIFLLSHFFLLEANEK